MYRVVLLVNLHICPKSGIETAEKVRLAARHPTAAHATAEGISFVNNQLAEGFYCERVEDEAITEAEQLAYRVQRAITYRKRKKREAKHG